MSQPEQELVSMVEPEEEDFVQPSASKVLSCLAYGKSDCGFAVLWQDIALSWKRSVLFCCFMNGMCCLME